MKSDRDQIIATIALLAEKYPRTFSLCPARRKPLAISIHNTILLELAGVITEDELNRVMRHYTWGIGYLRNSRAGAWRYDLQGNPAGVVTRKEDANARMRLAAVEKKLAVRKAEKQKAHEAAEAAKRPKRLGLADLKRAALERKGAQAANAVA
jgi:sRNA-binding protein